MQSSPYLMSFNDPEYSDLTVITGRDANGLVVKAFSLHKIIVLPRSTVLKSLVVGNEIDLSAEKPSYREALEAVFRFLYSGQWVIENRLLAACRAAVVNLKIEYVCFLLSFFLSFFRLFSENLLVMVG
jgi:hypothetical protein